MRNMIEEAKRDREKERELTAVIEAMEAKQDQEKERELTEEISCLTEQLENKRMKIAKLKSRIKNNKKKIRKIDKKIEQINTSLWKLDIRMNSTTLPTILMIVLLLASQVSSQKIPLSHFHAQTSDLSLTGNTAFDCRDVKIETILDRTKLADEKHAANLRIDSELYSTIKLLTLRSNGYLLEWDDKFRLNGSALIMKWPEIFRVTCKQTKVTYTKTTNTTKCYHEQATEVVTESGEITYINDQLFIISKPAETDCMDEDIEKVLRNTVTHKLNERQTVAAFTQSRNGETKEQHNYLFKNEKALYKLVVALQNCLCGEKEEIWRRVHFLYQRYVAKVSLCWSLWFSAFTGFLTIWALCIGVEWRESLKLVCPILRRLNDLLNFRKQRKILKQLDEEREMRALAGLEETKERIDNYANRHFTNLYQEINNIHKRIDNIMATTTENQRSDISDTYNDTSNDSTSNSSQSVSTSSTREKTDEDARRRKNLTVYFAK